MSVKALVLHAPGTNRDREAAWACELAGAAAEIVPLGALVAGERRLDDYGLLILPGGFSFGDDLGAGKVAALILRTRLGEALDAFIASGRPVIGICNGFQILVKAGFLPGTRADGRPTATLIANARGRFECRWITLEPVAGSACAFLADLTEPIFCPVAHGEGRVVFASELAARDAARQGLVALRYAPSPGAADGYPGNPNGSAGHVAALTNPAGNVLGLMPHPEDHLVPTQHPRYHRGERHGSGLSLFTRAAAYAARR